MCLCSLSWWLTKCHEWPWRTRSHHCSSLPFSKALLPNALTHHPIAHQTITHQMIINNQQEVPASFGDPALTNFSPNAKGWMTPPIMPVKPNPKSLWNKAAHSCESSPVTHLWPSPSTKQHQCIIKIAVMWESLFFASLSALTLSHRIHKNCVSVCGPHTTMCGVSVSHAWHQISLECLWIPYLHLLCRVSISHCISPTRSHFCHTSFVLWHMS